MNYDMTIGVILSAPIMNFTIPDDLSFFGFDKFAVTEAYSPKLTLIEQPTEKIGKMAAQLMIERIQGRWDDFPKVIELKAKMVINDSVAAVKDN